MWGRTECREVINVYTFSKDKKFLGQMNNYRVLETDFVSRTPLNSVKE
jgi:hypothetical protein